MQSKIGIFYRSRSQILISSIFGYTSRGVAGLEVKGMGSYGQLIKEKIVFYAKSKQLQCPRLKYVLCFDNSGGHHLTKIENKEQLELPCLMLFLLLSKQVQVSDFSDCFCLGRIGLDGEVEVSCYTHDFLATLKGEFKGPITPKLLVQGQAPIDYPFKIDLNKMLLRQR
jgi:hypothetical protein